MTRILLKSCCLLRIREKWLLKNGSVKQTFVRGCAGKGHILGKLHSQRHILGIFSLKNVRNTCVNVCLQTCRTSAYFVKVCHINGIHC